MRGDRRRAKDEGDCQRNQRGGQEQERGESEDGGPHHGGPPVVFSGRKSGVGMAALSRRRGADRVAEKASERLMESIPPVCVVWLRQGRRVFVPVAAKESTNTH